MAKHLALSFASSESISSASFDFVHSDAWGPAPSSLGGLSYYVYFIDDFLRYTWVYLMRSRSEVFPIYRQFAAIVHTLGNASRYFALMVLVSISPQPSVIYFPLTALFLSSRVLTLLLRMVLLRGNIVTFSRPLVLSFFQLPFLSVSGLKLL